MVEVYQNCNIFNDGARQLAEDSDVREDNLIRLEHGKPYDFGFGADGQKGVARRDDGVLHVVDDVADLRR